jgi:hypothetical protein
MRRLGATPPPPVRRREPRAVSASCALTRCGKPRLARSLLAQDLRQKEQTHAQANVILRIRRRLRRARAPRARAALHSRVRGWSNRTFARGRPLHYRHRRRCEQMSRREARVLFFSVAHARQADIERARSKAASSSRRLERAGVAELVDAPDLGSGDESRGGSNPSARTIFACGRPSPTDKRRA